MCCKSNSMLDSNSVARGQIAMFYRSGSKQQAVVTYYVTKKTKLNSVTLVRERTIPTERPPPVGEVSANFCG